jgi:hypothetical protein
MLKGTDMLTAPLMHRKRGPPNLLEVLKAVPHVGKWHKVHFLNQESTRC